MRGNSTLIRQILMLTAILSMSFIYEARRPASAKDVPNEPINVEMNSNVVGCADLEIVSATPKGSKRIEMHVRMTKRLIRNKGDYPCICDEQFNYFYAVYPRDTDVARETVWQTGMRAYSHNFVAGFIAVDKGKMIEETVEFPYFKSHARPYKHCYIVFGCRVK